MNEEELLLYYKSLLERFLRLSDGKGEYSDLDSDDILDEYYSLKDEMKRALEYSEA